MNSNEPASYSAVTIATATRTVARLEAKATHTALTFGESRALRHAKRILAA